MFLRASALFGLWLVLGGAGPGSLAAAAVTAFAGTWMSLRLLPPGTSRPSLVALAGLPLIGGKPVSSSH